MAKSVDRETRSRPRSRTFPYRREPRPIPVLGPKEASVGCGKHRISRRFAEPYTRKRVRDHVSQRAKRVVRRVVTGSADKQLHEWIAQSTKTIDKISFILGVFLLLATEFVVLCRPQQFRFFYVSF